MPTKNANVSEPESHFDLFMKVREEASIAFVNGDFSPLEKISTHHSPATIFGPRGDCIQGAEQVNAANAKGAHLFKPGSKSAFEVMHKAAGDTVAYWTGIQRSVVLMQGQERAVPMDLRVTEVFRLEGDTWKLVHRHADRLASEGAA